MTRLSGMLAALLLLAGTGGALSQEDGADADRYAIERSGDRILRLDRRSGAMSTCEERGGQLVCRLAADERNAYEGRIDALEERIEALEARIAALEGRPAPDGKLPGEEQFEQSLSMMERFFRRFWDIVRDFERDLRSPDPEETEPQRT